MCPAIWQQAIQHTGASIGQSSAAKNNGRRLAGGMLLPYDGEDIQGIRVRLHNESGDLEGREALHGDSHHLYKISRCSRCIQLVVKVACVCWRLTVQTTIAFGGNQQLLAPPFCSSQAWEAPALCTAAASMRDPKVPLCK